MNTQWLLFWCRQSTPFWRATVWRSPICQSSWVRRIDARSLAAAFTQHDTTGEITILDATPEQREQVEISARGLHWDSLDEDISVAGLLAGHGDRTRQATLTV